MTPTLVPGAADTVKMMMRRALKAALATKDRGTGVPYASLVQVATCLDGRPVILVSDLAVHTRNLLADPSGSLLIDESDSTGDPATGARVSVSGRFSVDLPLDARARYLARHPGAAQFADFGDFRFLLLEVESAHFIQGFGRIMTLPGDKVVAKDIMDERARIRWVAGAAELSTEYPGVTGLDPDGLDLVEGGRGLRVSFPGKTNSVDQAIDMARKVLAVRN